MKVNLNSINYYFLTCDTNGIRKHHIMNIFKDYSINEINPIIGIERYKSGASGFLRMIDAGLSSQDSSLPFQPFVLLEDDCSIYREFPKSIEIPDDADLLYIGISRCGTYKKTSWQNKVYMKEINSDIVRIFNMLSTHGIMICSSKGASVITTSMNDAYKFNQPWDLRLTSMQPYYNIYALRAPLVYQDSKYKGAEPETRIEFKTVLNEDLPKEYYMNETEEKYYLS